MSKKYLVFFFVFIVICLLTPVYFMADDWEHLNWYHQGLPPYTLIQLFYRHTGLYIVHQLFFPLFAEGYFFFAKILIYGMLVSSSFLICDLFIEDFRLKMKNSYLFILLPLFMSFAPNQYEWNYWPTNMTCISSMFLMVLCFWLEKKYKYYSLAFVKNIAYIFAGFTFESLIPLAVLLELSFIIYREKRSFEDMIKKILNRTLPFLIIFLLAKYKMNSLAPFPYDAKWGFKLHLFQQWLSIFFSHDYYKTRHLTGSVVALCLLFLVVMRWRKIEKDLFFKELFLFFALIVGSSYYWLIQDYSSRRALGGQLYFYWGWVSLFLFSILEKRKEVGRPIYSITLVFILFTFIHHGHVFHTKYNEKFAIDRNVKKAKSMLKSYEGNSFHFDAHFPRQGIGRAWNFIGVRQLNGFLRHSLTKEEQAKIKFEDASHKRKVPPPPF